MKERTKIEIMMFLTYVILLITYAFTKSIFLMFVALVVAVLLDVMISRNKNEEK